jgi:hypothetical protein
MGLPMSWRLGGCRGLAGLEEGDESGLWMAGGCERDLGHIQTGILGC